MIDCKDDADHNDPPCEIVHKSLLIDGLEKTTASGERLVSATHAAGVLSFLQGFVRPARETLPILRRTPVATDQLCRTLYEEIVRIPLLDPHSHIDPLRPTSNTLDDILGYHYYTELAHSCGMSQVCLAGDFSPRQRVRIVLSHLEHFDNTAQYAWFVEIARTFLGFPGRDLDAEDADSLFDASERVFCQPDWEQQVWKLSNLEKVFLTNEFDDPLEGFDTNRYVPCLRTDALVFQGQTPEVMARLARATGIEVGNGARLRQALRKLFEHFTGKGARACAISLPPDFRPTATSDDQHPHFVFWTLAELCREFGLPFDLMIGVNRKVYPRGVYQGQDLYDGRTSLIHYADLFNAFPEVTFPISVLSSGLNQELASYAWIFPNVVTSGHWWYSNIPGAIAADLRHRLQAVPKIKQIGYYSDMYKLEFGLPKFNMYRRILANVLADDFVRPGFLDETGALGLARHLLHDNVKRIFKV
jgi:glucuronate isomerase